MTKENNKENKLQFYTYDLGLASSLITCDCELSGLDKTNPQKVKFIFKHNEEVEKIVDNYWNGYLKINSRQLFENQKMLKNRIYSQ